MKKVLMLSMVLISLVLVGCGTKATDYSKIMRAQAKAYYEKYQTGVTGNDIFEISLTNLKNANEKSDGDFDVKALSDCKDSSYVELFVARGTTTITKYEDHLNCTAK